MTLPEGLTHVHSGKVRDLYRTVDGLLLVVASDRISAYDHVLETAIPDKGRILTALSVWWFEQLGEALPTHLISADDPAIPDPWRGRSMLCRPLDMVKVECVARGYLTGSGLLDYRATGRVCGIDLPPGLTDGSRLPAPLFTPTTKADLGAHDEPMTFDDTVAAVGAELAIELRRVTLDIYARGAAVAQDAGLILADTKIELGMADDGQLVLADEVLTPDSSRFWAADRWHPGRPQPSYDKQYVRDWLLSRPAGWDRRGGAPPPRLPEDVVDATRERYVAAYEMLTGLRFADWLAPAG